MLNIVCVKLGDKYPAEYMVKLASMVKRNMTREYRFYCITDDPYLSGETIIRSDEGNVGWWGKLQAFKHGLFKDGDHILLIDLDSLILKDLDELVEFGIKQLERDFPMVIIENFGKPGEGKYGSALVMFEANKLPHVYNDFVKDRESIQASNIGDQDYLLKAVPSARFWPREMVQSYKIDYLRKRDLAPEAVVMCFHGHPRNHEVNEGWVKAIWR